MAIPGFQAIFLPFLKLAGDQKEHHLREAKDELADQFNLSSEEKSELLPSGRQKIFDNRVGWARTYLKKAGLIEYAGRGVFKITPRGLEILAKKSAAIDVKFLKQFPEFMDFHIISRAPKASAEATKDDRVEHETPEESLEFWYQKLRENLANELLIKIKEMPPSFFEELVVELLVSMGYGGSMSDAGQSIGKSGDGGIDGIIKEDKLGLDIIYIQAKRWDTGTVGRPEIQKFAGALQGHRAKKGVFITTSIFAKNAFDYISTIDSKIVLIDGNRLTHLMIENDIGVSRVASYEVKRIDSDFFTEE